ncbi:reverse transcriptase domain protein [Purpureocillium lavendulum]|uniref:Reverse transcriptase domain protein n=1 Tax=Purpureocillium lavendulum TaxID=1247861 RepID=A0AB34G684_9HYPO|nr:reverse transcriptase domain protein [Purpureocillium lavendulum]
MARRPDVIPSFREPTIVVSPAVVDPELSRGRKRSRSTTRTDVKSLRSDESSNLRGRSPRRATSPFGLVSRNTSPSMLSPTTQILRYNQLRNARREHCPSRTGSPADQRPFRRRQRTRSRSRGPGLEQDPRRSLETLSSLRNEVLIMHDDDSVNEDDK